MDPTAITHPNPYIAATRHIINLHIQSCHGSASTTDPSSAHGPPSAHPVCPNLSAPKLAHRALHPRSSHHSAASTRPASPISGCSTRACSSARAILAGSTSFAATHSRGRALSRYSAVSKSALIPHIHRPMSQPMIHKTSHVPLGSTPSSPVIRLR
ncbi:hypothetical protein H2248_007482 [Termitomyces sp. 'cryptogamus']|nr:hypothetical protein H2248_007482 [Termitomyces sp. 'cryptogamus']